MNKPIKDSLISSQIIITKDILHRCEVVDSRCILAGGAPRSWILDNKPARDLDIYIRTKYCNESWVKRFMEVILHDYNLVKCEQLGVGYRITEEYRTTKNQDHLLSVYDCVCKPFDPQDCIEYNIQFMFILDNTKDILETFTNSMCKIYGKDIDLAKLPQNQIDIRVNGYHHTLNDFVLSDFMKTMFVDDVTSKHTEKMKQYYPNHKVMQYTDIERHINTIVGMCGDEFFTEYYEHEKMLKQRILDFNKLYF